MHDLSPETIVAFLADVLERRGGESYLGEAVSMRQHMLQAALLAEQAGAGDELIAAALLHDIGHYTGEFPEDAIEQGIDNYHETAGAKALEPYFPSLVVECVRHHVMAKRFLYATDTRYRSVLSDASIRSLELQGGPLDARSAARFANHPDLESIIAVRRWDDDAKEPGRRTPGFSYFRPVLERLVARHAEGAD